MVLLHNPAGLVKLVDDQVMLDVDVAFHDMCVKPYGYYGWGVYTADRSEFGDPLELDNATNPTIGATYASSPLRKVCNSAAPGPVPQLAWTHRMDDWAIGAGFVLPTSLTGLQYGGEDGTINTRYGPRPTPTRYGLVKQEVLFGLNPTFGVAYRVLPQLSVGATLQVLMARARSVAVQNSATGTQPSTDWLVDLETEDFFIPSVTISALAEPIETIDLMLAFHWVDDVSGPGKVKITTNTYYEGAASGPVPFENAPVELSRVSVPLPWSATAGARYAQPLSHPHGTPLGSVRDPMNTELWDAEVDVTYSLNARASTASVEAGEDVRLTNRNADGTSNVTVVSKDDLARFYVDRHLVDSVALRIGGSYSVVPRVLAVMAGTFYETRGVEIAYADVDSFAFRRIGVSTGAVLRSGSFDMRVGFAHIFSETVDLAPPPHQRVENARPGDPRSGFDQRVGGTFDQDGVRVGGVVLKDPNAPSPSEADAVAAKTQNAAIVTAARPERVVNAGRYTAAFNVVSVGVVYHF